jgi:hypothetical protein
MKNSCFFQIGWQPDLGVDTARPERRMHDMLIVRSEDDDWFLVIFAHANVSIVFRQVLVVVLDAL